MKILALILLVTAIFFGFNEKAIFESNNENLKYKPSIVSNDPNKLGNYEIYAHRGDFKFYAENTRQAFISAFEKSKYEDSPKIVGVELDVQLTNDGKIVVLHDQTIRRTAFQPDIVKPQSLLDDPIETLNYDDIKNIQVGPNKNDTIITLQDAVNLVAQKGADYDYTDKKILIELKSYQNAPESIQKKMLESLRTALKDFDQSVKDRLTLISFDESILYKTMKIEELKSIKKFSIYLKEDLLKLTEEELRAKMRLMKALGYDGYDVEMGEYLRDSNIPKLAKETNLKLISWPYFAKRGDGPIYQALARDIGIDIFTSDLPADTVLSSRLMKRAEQSLAVLKKAMPDKKITLLDNEKDGIYRFKIEVKNYICLFILTQPKRFFSWRRCIRISTSKSGRYS